MFDRYLTAEIEKEEVQAEIVDTKVLGNPQVSYIPIPPFAEIGQTIVVKEVDKNGRPTKWEPKYYNADIKDGFSPIVDVNSIKGGHSVSITDKNGEKKFNVMDGKDGDDRVYVLKEGESLEDVGEDIEIVIDPTEEKDDLEDLKGEKGEKGDTGNGISSIAKTKTEGLVDTYTITFTNGETTTFTVTNGAAGAQGVQGIQGVPGKDGHTPVITIENGRWYIDGVDSGKSAEGVKGATGATGQRGTGILKVTTEPSSYTTAIDGYTPQYRILLSVVKKESGVGEVLLGDIIQYSYYQYHIDYLDSSYAYTSATRVSIRGADGATGTTPVKGTDYWTSADQESIVQDVIAALGTPVFGTVDADKNIDLTGELADGVYTVRYRNEDGTFTKIGVLVHTVVPEPTYTNLLASATDESGAVLNGVGYRNEYRFSSYGGDIDQDTSGTTGYFATGFMPYTLVQLQNRVPIYVQGITLDLTDELPPYLRFTMCVPGSGEWVGVITLKDKVSAEDGFDIVQLADKYYKFTPRKNTYKSDAWDTKWPSGTFNHMRWTLPGSGAGVIITVNEPIE
jgi:hypothetical protein